MCVCDTAVRGHDGQVSVFQVENLSNLDTTSVCVIMFESHTVAFDAARSPIERMVKFEGLRPMPPTPSNGHPSEIRPVVPISGPEA